MAAPFDVEQRVGDLPAAALATLLAPFWWSPGIRVLHARTGRRREDDKWDFQFEPNRATWYAFTTQLGNVDLRFVGLHLVYSLGWVTTVLAATAAQADAAATMIANQVNTEHPGIMRQPANQVRDDTDLGHRAVTRWVPPLPLGQIMTALQRGLAYAQGLVDRGLIHAALIACQNRYAACGLESYWEADIQGDLAA